MLPTSAWQEHRVYLADVLDEDLWNQLFLTYGRLETEQARLVIMGKDFPPGTPLTDPVIEKMKDFTKTLERLRQELEHRSGSRWRARRGL